MQNTENAYLNNLILRNNRSGGIPRFCGITRYFESGFFRKGDFHMRVCHVLGPYFQGKISERVFQFFTKIRERVIIFGGNSIVYVDLVWTNNPKCSENLWKMKAIFSSNSPQVCILETSIKHKNSEKGRFKDKKVTHPPFVNIMSYLPLGNFSAT